MPPIKGQNILIIGGFSGIGAAVKKIRGAVPNATSGGGGGGGLFGITRGLVLDLLPIRTNLVSLGAMNTEMLREGEGREQLPQIMAKSSLTGKTGTSEEVAEAYIYLKKDTNTTESCVSTSGGALVQSAENINFG
ncbi:hypothetical protein F4804DRAFT_331787 [Jackrogersella minutella]|nr:hypothetical protein F4804DRAFT_331787 [Jackrogersella minutella]